MTTYYVDSSALIKRYVDETGSDWLRATLGVQPSPAVIVVHLVTVEMTSAFTRRLREGVLTPEEYACVQDAVQADCLYEYEMVMAAGQVLDRASRLLEQHPLRAYDAVHLATAIITNQQLLTHEQPPLTFLCADDRLNRAAEAEWLAVDNPNHHP